MYGFICICIMYIFECTSMNMNLHLHIVGTCMYILMDFLYAYLGIYVHTYDMNIPMNINADYYVLEYMLVVR